MKYFHNITVANIRNTIAKHLLLISFLLSSGACSDPPPDKDALPFDAMAGRIAERLFIAPGERVLVGYDPEHMPELAVATRQALSAAGAHVEMRVYGADDGFAERLERSDIYIWLPFGPGSPSAPRIAEFAVASAWVMRDEHRQLHFHWDDGSRAADGMVGAHSPELDAIYLDGLNIDYHRLDSDMRRVAGAMRGGELRVTTPAGTDIRFSLGDRPITVQSGNASRAALRDAVVPIQREIELPAGALRVAPLEDSVSGVVVIEKARLSAAPWDNSADGAEPAARQLRLTFKAGRLVDIGAAEGQEAFRRFVAGNPALGHFREFAVGFNPRLTPPEDSAVLPYYGYGSGVVRLSIGNNRELGGAVDGDGIRWFLFGDATVTMPDGSVLVKDGILQVF